MRIVLYTIMEHLENEWLPHLIRNWFGLTEQQMQGILAYIAAHREEVEVEYRQVLQEAAETEQYWREYNREHLAKVAVLVPKLGQEEIYAKLRARKMLWR